MDVAPDETDENGTTFKITSNLPDNTDVVVEVSNDDLHYDSKFNGQIVSGILETDSFTSNKHSLPNDDYRIEITSSLESNQHDKSVREAFGKNGSNLQGQYVKEDDTIGKSVWFVKNISITNSTTDMFDAQPSPKIGMTKDELLGSNWGNPESINKTTTENGIEEQWCYSGFRYIYLDNGVVTTIQDH